MLNNPHTGCCHIRGSSHGVSPRTHRKHEFTVYEYEGGEREVQIYLNNDGRSLRVCTGGLTNISTDDKDQINLAYKIPFENKQEEK